MSSGKLAVVVQLERSKGLAVLRTIEDVRSYDGRLAALEEYARTKRLDLPTHNRIVLARALVQRRGGELVQAIPLGKPGRGKKGGKRLQLGSILVARSVAQRWEWLVTMKEAAIRAAVEQRTAAKQTVTLGFLYGLARPPARIQRTPSLPGGPYRTVVIDPPWPIEKVSLERRSLEKASLDYPTMTLRQIQALDVPKIADEHGAHIYLWSTHHFLPEAFRLFEHWGVRFECLLTWNKPSAKPLWWTYVTEHCLFGKIGSLQPLVRGTPTGFEAPQQDHSHKPDEFFELVRKVSPEPRLTMFDNERNGFQCWGIPHVAA